MHASNNRLVIQEDVFNTVGLIDGLLDGETNGGSDKVTGGGAGGVPSKYLMEEMTEDLKRGPVVENKCNLIR